MKLWFVDDGESRLHRCPAHLARLRDLRETIRAAHAAEWERSGFFRRLLLRQRMAAEFRTERRKIEPSGRSLFGRA